MKGRIDLIEKHDNSFYLKIKIQTKDAGTVIFDSVYPPMNRSEAEYRLFKISHILDLDRPELPSLKEKSDATDH